MRTISPLSRAAAVLVCGLVAAGCCSRRYDIMVSADEGLRDATGAMPSIEVHVVGVNRLEYSKWYSYSMGDYWLPGDPFRRDADKHVMKFGQGLPLSQTLDRNDPIWRRWEARKPNCVFVLAFLHGFGAEDDQAGSADPRRLILPLDCACWENPKIKLLVRSSGVRCLTVPKTTDQRCIESPDGFKN